MSGKPSHLDIDTRGISPDIINPDTGQNESSDDSRCGGKISVALVGAGKMGEKWAEAITSHPKTELTAIIDNDFYRVSDLARKYRVSFFRYYRNLDVYEVGARAIILALPNQFMADAALEILKMGKHVLAEKPAGKNSSEIEELVKIAKEKKLVFMPGYNHRHLPHIKKAKEFVESGEIGKIMFIRGTHGASGRPGYEKEWRHQKSSGGGIMLDQSVHMVDLTRWFLGDFIKVSGMAKNLFWNSEVEDNAFLHMESADGALVSLHTSWTEWKPKFLFEIFGTTGYIIADGLKNYLQTERLTIGKRSDDFLGSKVKEEVIIFDDSSPNSLSLELDEFVSAIEEGRESKPNGRDAMEILKIVEKVRSPA